ncbi:exodeoxyribonuclease VII large subunit [Desertivirga xinjiangensis]|uniref:exodeoxyribonuclease VII large subunit n=1 Tax=Desertivirga xinjiangensis TaxID=539206 RepID=UPI00210D97BB|nr:exodeoxyribonuclease VII large subunit [Pedobacter xinjiangensis]
MPVQSYIGLKQLLLRIQNQLRGGFPASYWIRAEVAGIRRTGSHIYFELLELERGVKVAQVKGCAFYGEGTTAISDFEKVTGQKFIEGIKIGLRVSVNYHPVYGLSLVLCEIDAQLTLGGIELQRKQTLEKLLADHPGIIRLQDGNYITPNKLLPLPRVIQHIALLTSETSDAYNDFMHCLQSNSYQYNFHVDVYSVLVHGYGAATSLAQALHKLTQSGMRYDAVVISRGGGAPADFLPFDDYHLALQLARMPIPVITGIGHHMNQGICDFFARVHTKTPSIAAQFIIDRNHSFEKQLLSLSASIKSKGIQLLGKEGNDFQRMKRELNFALEGLVRNKQVKLSNFQRTIFHKATELLVSGKHQLKNKQLYLSSKSQLLLHRYEKELAEKALTFTFIPKQIIRAEKQRSLAFQKQLLSRLPQVVDLQKRELNSLKDNIQNLSPEKILKRGFALIKKNGKIISDSSDVNPGDSLQIVHQQFLIDTEVKNKTDYNGNEFNV